MRKWFKHGKWPKWMVSLHYYTIVSFILLMITGLALFLPAIHTPLIPYLPVIYYVHIVLGLIFGVTLLMPVVMRLGIDKLIRRFDWFFPLALGTVIVITGIFIWKVNWFPTTWRSLAFHWHARISYALSALLILHAAYKAVGYRPAPDGPNGKVDPNRRRFLHWVGLGVVGTAFLTVIDPVTVLRNAVKFPTKPTPPGSTFAAYYRVTPTYPTANLETYKLEVNGNVANPVTLSWQDVKQLAAASETADFHCVTGWSVAGVKWKGIRMQTLIDLVKPAGNVRFVHFYSFDGVYTESLYLQEATDPNIMLAYEMDGKPLRTEQGFPVRLVVPNMYGYKSIKWVRRVEFSDKPLVGYWEQRGYPNEAYLTKGI